MKSNDIWYKTLFVLFFIYLPSSYLSSVPRKSVTDGKQVNICLNLVGEMENANYYVPVWPLPFFGHLGLFSQVGIGEYITLVLHHLLCTTTTSRMTWKVPSSLYSRPGFPNHGSPAVLDYNSHLPWLAEPGVRGDGNCSPKTAENTNMLCKPGQEDSFA